MLVVECWLLAVGCCMSMVWLLLWVSLLVLLLVGGVCCCWLLLWSLLLFLPLIFFGGLVGRCWCC